MSDVADALKFARSAERLLAVGQSLGAAADGLTHVAEIDPELKPEIIAALESIHEVMGAIERAVDFVSARWEVAHG